ncbi:restriction endonuclease subunit S [Desulforhopalus sp. IMCC35007]|uniref:restriction endonuclease subunit S n=1 Tax=Desulforhopalus sp. IMCC35007 TaxID=2569543 RepID=UPI00352BBA9C
MGKYSVGTSQVVLSINELKKIKFKIPCDDEQKEISQFSLQLDTKITTVQTQLTQTQNLKKGLLQKMFV